MIYNKLLKLIEGVCVKFDEIDLTRKQQLQSLVLFLKERRDNELVNLNFICTHNSRRSHLAQVWAQVAAHHYGVENVVCYSGGTAATALYASVLGALEDAGMQVQKLSNTDNPVYAIKYDANKPAVIGFSKIYDDGFNPQSDFAAIMVCNDADANCPLIPNAAVRISLPYEDPKRFDDSDLQDAKYIERSLQIATEMLYVFSKVK